MDYYCEIYDIFIKHKNNYKNFKANNHKNFNKRKHIELTVERPDLENKDKAFHAYIIKRNKKHDYYLVKGGFKFFFDNYQFCPYVTSLLSDNKTMCYWQNFLEKANNDLKNKGYTFNHIAEMNIIAIANKLDMSYDFFIRHNIPAVEWKLNAMINKNERLINELNRNWRYPLIRKFSHVPISNVWSYTEQ